MTISIDYSKLIQNNPRSFEFMEPFLGKYLPLLEITENYRVLDIGSFQGSNLLPFVEFGAEKLYGVDKERIPVEIFSNKIYKEYGPRVHKTLDLKIGKIEEYTFPKSLDLILAFRVFQHLSKKDSVETILKMQLNTKRNGFNLLIIWENGNNFDPNLGYFNEKEIRELYKNWDLIESQTKIIKDFPAVYFIAKKRYFN